MTIKEGENRKILVVDDDRRIVQFVAANLKAHGYTVSTADNGQMALDRAAEVMPDIVLLDLSLPVFDGITVLRRLREWTATPVIILSASDDEESKVEALDVGADDYLTKPFGVKELLARVRVAIRRAAASNAGTAANTVSPVFKAGDLEVDMSARTVRMATKEVRLTPTEYSLLHYLITHAGKVVQHRELLQRVWGPEYGEETEYLRTFIKQLRRKIEADPAHPVYLLTEPGVGYRFRIG